VETGLLVLTALYVIYEAFDRLFFHSVHIQPSVTAILVLLVALSIDITRAKRLSYVAKKYSSEALEADALHFSTDVWSTIVVISGIALVWVGERWNVPWLVYADALAGLTVAAVILWVGSRLGRRTLDALLDAAPEGLQERITNAVGQMDGVLNVKRLRLRRAGNRYFVDATVSVPRTASLEQVHAWSDAIEQRVGEIVPSDVVVHAEPRAPKGEPFFDSIRAVAQRRGLAIHDLSAQQNDGRLFVELHLEIDPHLSLKEAHAQATELEEEIRGLRQEPTEVNIHIEPLGTAISSPDAGAENLRVLARAIESFLNQLPAEYHELLSSHNVVVRQVEHHILASCHCVIRSELPVMEVHDVTAALEDRVKEKFPQIYRVTIHPEPEDA
jgi:cation diffusion facilitator family transporter